MYVNKYICIYIYIYIYTHTYIYIYICTHIYIYTHVHIYISINIHIYIYTCIHMYIYIHIHIHIHIHIYIFKYIYIYVCVCVWECTCMYIHIYIHIYIYIYIRTQEWEKYMVNIYWNKSMYSCVCLCVHVFERECRYKTLPRAITHKWDYTLAIPTHHTCPSYKGDKALRTHLADNHIVKNERLGARRWRHTHTPSLATCTLSHRLDFGVQTKQGRKRKFVDEALDVALDFRRLCEVTFICLFVFFVCPFDTNVYRYYIHILRIYYTCVN